MTLRLKDYFGVLVIGFLYAMLRLVAALGVWNLERRSRSKGAQTQCAHSYWYPKSPLFQLCCKSAGWGAEEGTAYLLHVLRQAAREKWRGLISSISFLGSALSESPHNVNISS